MHMRYKRYLLLLLLVLPSMVRLRAQDDTQLSQYWAMPSYYNAGAAGIYEKLNLRAATRQQWVGMPGAPKSFLVLADMPLRFLKADHGIGLQLSNDSYGRFKTTAIGKQYGYKGKFRRVLHTQIFLCGTVVNPPIPTGNFVRRKLRRLDHPRILFHSRRQYSSEKCVI